MNMQQPKIHIKYLYVGNATYRRKYIYEVAIVTDDDIYVDYSVTFQVNRISNAGLEKLLALFQPYCIDRRTEVYFLETVSDKSTFYMYFTILRQQIQFRMFHSINMDKVIRKICSKIGCGGNKRNGWQASKINHKNTKQAWDAIIRTKSCPWITQNVQDELSQAHGYDLYYIKRNSRLVLYYAHVKAVFRMYGKKGEYRRLVAQGIDPNQVNIQTELQEENLTDDEFVWS